MEEETNQDWQSNLSNWKMMRRSHSAYPRAQDLVDEVEVKDDIHRRQKSKTYKEMMEERERRKSTNEAYSSIDFSDGDFNFESSKARAASHDDLNRNNISSTENVSKSNLNQKNLKDSDVQNQNSFSGTHEEIKKVSVPVLGTQSTDKKSQRYSDSVSLDQQGVKTNTTSNVKTITDNRKSSNFSSNRNKFESGNSTTSTPKSASDVKPQMPVGTNVADRMKMWNKPAEVSHPPQSSGKSFDQKKLEKGAANIVEKSSTNMFVEKSIRITQRPNHEKGFGFTIAGGRGDNSPIVVDRVVRGGSADICELKAGDEIIAINGADVARHYNESVQTVLDQSVANGTIELKIKRLRDLEEDFEEDIFSDDGDFEPTKRKNNHDFLGSQSSIWSSPPTTPPALPAIGDTSDYLLPPPPLPSVPPPPPNWSTFPGQIASPPVTTAPPKAESTPLAPRSEPFTSNGAITRTSLVKDLDKQYGEVADKSKEDILRRRSQFLGLKLEESQEFQALQEDKEKKTQLGRSNAFEQFDSQNYPNDHPSHKLSSTEFQKTKQLNGHSGTDWSADKYSTANAIKALDIAREERDKERLREKEEQLRLQEEKIRQETERLEKEKQRLAREAEERLSEERERLRRESEQQLQRERERLAQEQEQQLRLAQDKIHHEKEEQLRRQTEGRLKLEKERLEKEKQEQINRERERIMHESAEALRREKEQLQREQEHRRRELDMQIQLEQDKKKFDQQRQQINSMAGNQAMKMGGYDSKGLVRKPSEEPTDIDVAEYSHRYGGKTFARIAAAQARSESLGDIGASNKHSIKGGNVARMASLAEVGLETQKPSASKLEKADISANFSLIRSNFENNKLNADVPEKMEFSMQKQGNKSFDPNYDTRQGNQRTSAPSVTSAPFVTSYGVSEGSHDHGLPKGRPQFLDDIVAMGQKSMGPNSGESGSGLAPRLGPQSGPQFGERTSSLSVQLRPEKSSVGPQIGQRTSSIGPPFGDRTSSVGPPFAEKTSSVGPPFGDRTSSMGPQIGERTSSMGPPFGDRTSSVGTHLRPEADWQKSSVGPQIGERKSSMGPHFGEKTSSAGPPFGDRTSSVGLHLGPQHDRTSSLGPQLGSQNPEFGSRHPREQVPAYGHHPQVDTSLLRKSQPDWSKASDTKTNEPKSPVLSHSNIGFLLYGDRDGDDNRVRDTIGQGGYNSNTPDYNKPRSPSVRPTFDENGPSFASDQPGRGSQRHQFNESWPNRGGTLPASGHSDRDRYEGDMRPPVRSQGPQPFESARHYSTGIGDHWLVEEAERRRISEQTGQPRSWNYQEPQSVRDSGSFQRPRDARSSSMSEHMHFDNPPYSGVPVNPYANKPSMVESHSLRSPKSVPEPVKQSLLNRINEGSSLKSPTSHLGPLPSYPKDYSHPAPVHSRSVSNPVSDLNYFPPGNRQPSPHAFPASSESYGSPPRSSGAAVDSLFDYHRSSDRGSNLLSHQGLSRSQGSLHLDGTPQYPSKSHINNVPKPYHAPSNQNYGYTTVTERTSLPGQSQSYRVVTTGPGYSGRDSGSFPQYCQPVVNNLLCSVCQRPLTEVYGNVFMKDGDLRLHCQYCYQQDQVKYSKV